MTHKPLAVDDTVDVTITRLVPYGAWFDYAGQEGLINIPEISWRRISHPSDVLTIGQVVGVKILVVNGESISASVRALHPEQDPWYDPTLFAVGTEFTAPVVRVLEYGCFVELRPEVWGLLRRERWQGSIAVGDNLRVKVGQVDAAGRKIEVALLSES